MTPPDSDVMADLSRELNGHATGEARRAPSPEDAAAYREELAAARAIEYEKDVAGAAYWQRVKAEASRRVQAEAGDAGQAGVDRLVDGATFILDEPDEVPAVWGRGEDVLWAEGEPLMITGPTGVGKTTLGGQVIRARLGIQADVLGYPVAPAHRVLYLAMDRPRQIARAVRRQLRDVPRETLEDQLKVWPGPPPADLARHPEVLLDLCRRADADTVVLDSLKDAAVKLSEEETGQGLNTAIQHCIAAGIEVLVYHHQRKGSGDTKPKTIADIYGSTWIPAGMGSILLLWGTAGDPVVELSHLKQPAAPVGPLQVVHDHDAGTTAVADAQDPVDMLSLGPRTARDLARVITGSGDPKRNEVEKVRRRLEKAVKAGRVIRLDETSNRGGAAGGAEGIRYGLAADARHEATHEPMHAPPFGETDARPHARRTRTPKTAGQATHDATHATHAGSDARNPPPFKGAGARAPTPPEAHQAPLGTTEFDPIHRHTEENR